MWISNGGWGGGQSLIEKFLNVIIINFEKVDKPRGGVDKVDEVILLNFGIFVMLFSQFKGSVT